MRNTKDYEKLSKMLLPFGIGVRIVFFIINLFIGGYNSDEVMTSLNAVSLAQKGTDIMGERLPVYFDTWVIGGQSPFATYLSALSVKIFGFNNFGVRFFALIFSIIALIALYGFAKEVFKNSEYTAVLTGLGCFCPWAIFSGIYVLDCNYLGHILIVALYFFARAINSDKTKFYIISMVFFALGFYCYIASVLFIPVLLLTLYLILLIKKRISFKNAAISVITVFTVALPFILFGLVTTGIIKPFELFGFSFNEMPGYLRETSTVFIRENPLKMVSGILTNIVFSFILTVFADAGVFALGANIFQYGNLFCGAFFVLGLVVLGVAVFKKSKEFSFVQKLFASAFFLSLVFYSAMINDNNLGTLYRKNVFSYLLINFTAVGFTKAAGALKKVDIKKTLCVYLSLSLALFSLTFAFVYTNQVNPKSQTKENMFLYGDSYYACLDFAKENGYDTVTTYKSNSSMYTSAVFIRHYYYDDIDNFILLEEEIDHSIHYYNDVVPELKLIEDKVPLPDLKQNSDSTYLLTEDGKVLFKYYVKNDTVNQDFCIIESAKLPKLKYDKNTYSVKNFGFWSAVYKTE